MGARGVIGGATVYEGCVRDVIGQYLTLFSGRYVAYVGNACPWCHRVALTVALRGRA